MKGLDYRRVPARLLVLLVLGFVSAPPGVSATRLRSAVIAPEASSASAGPTRSCGNTMTLPFDTAFRAQRIDELLASYRAGLTVSAEEALLLDRYSSGLTLTDLEATVLVSRVLYEAYVGTPNTGESTWNLRQKLLAQYRAYVATQGRGILTGGTSTLGDACGNPERGGCFDALSDGSFEGGTPSAVWTEYSLNFGTPICTASSCGTGAGTAGPRTGSYWAWFGGCNCYEEGSLSQSFNVPAGSTLELTFYGWWGAVAGGDDIIEVMVDTTVIATLVEPASAESGYSLYTFDLSAYGDGASHTLAFVHTGGEEVVSNFSLDDVALETCPPIGAFDICCPDDFSGDTFSMATTTGEWEYFDSDTGQLFTGVAESVRLVPGRSLNAYDRDDPCYVMQIFIDYVRNTCVVTVTERQTNTQHRLRDRNILNNPPCGAERS